MFLPLLVDGGAFAGGVSDEQRLVDRIDGGEPALLEALQYLVEDLKQPGHAQADQSIAKPHDGSEHVSLRARRPRPLKRRSG